MVNPDFVANGQVGEYDITTFETRFNGDFVRLDEMTVQGPQGPKSGLVLYHSGKSAVHSISDDTLQEWVIALEMAQKMGPIGENFLITYRPFARAHAGGDIQDTLKRSEGDKKKFVEWARGRLDLGYRVNELYHQLAEQTTVVATANGLSSFGGSFETLLMSDYIVAPEDAKFSLPELGLGLIPGWGGTANLAARTSILWVTAMTLLGQALSGIELKNYGAFDGIIRTEKYPKDDEAAQAAYAETQSRELFAKAFDIVYAPQAREVRRDINAPLRDHESQAMENADPKRYQELFGKSRKELTSAGLMDHLSEAALYKQLCVIMMLKGMPPQERRDRALEVARYAARLDGDLYEFHTEQLKRGIDARLKGVVPDFRGSL